MPLPLGLLMSGAVTAFRLVSELRGGNNVGIVDAAKQLANTGHMPGFPPKARGPLMIIASTLETYGERDMNVDEAISLIETAAREGRDLTNEEIDTYMAGTDAIADRVEDKLSAIEAKHEQNQ